MIEEAAYRNWRFQEIAENYITLISLQESPILDHDQRRPLVGLPPLSEHGFTLPYPWWLQLARPRLKVSQLSSAFTASNISPYLN